MTYQAEHRLRSGPFHEKFQTEDHNVSLKDNAKKYISFILT